jgi:hypothetical protein
LTVVAGTEETAAGAASAREVVAATLGGAAVWLSAHFGVFLAGGWWNGSVAGEWDVLITSLLIAGGDLPLASIGTIHGWELGSYLTGMAAAVPVALGLEPIAASRLTAAGIGAVGAGAAVGSVYGLVREQGRPPAFAASLFAVTIALCWPAWHAANLGLTGTTLEAAVLLVPALVLASRPRTDPGRVALVGFLLALAILYSPVAVLAVPACAVLLATSDLDASRPKGLAGFAAGTLLPIGLLSCLPGGRDSIASLRWFLMDAARRAFDGSGPAAITPEGLPSPAVPGVFASVPESLAATPDVAALMVPAAAFGVVALLSSLVLAVGRNTPSRLRRLALGALSWPLLLVLVGFDSPRYWMPAVLLTAIPAGTLASFASPLWHKCLLGLIPAAGLAVLTVPPPQRLPPRPPIEAVFVQLGGHRTVHRSGLPDDASERHGTFLAIRGQIPTEHLNAFEQGYGLSLADDFGIPMLDFYSLEGWLDEWSLGHLDRRLDDSSWRSVLFGLGCGLALQPELDGERWALIRQELDSAREPSLYHGVHQCLGHRVGAVSDGEQLGRIGRPSTPRAERCLAAGCEAESLTPVRSLWRFSNAAPQTRPKTPPNGAHR